MKGKEHNIQRDLIGLISHPLGGLLLKQEYHIL